MNNKVFSVTVRGTEVGINLIQSAIKAIMNRNQSKPIGKQSIKELNKQGVELTNNVVSSVDLKPFEKELRKFGVDYAVIKDNTNTNTYNVYFKAKDVSQIDAALKSYTQKVLKQAEKPSIADKIKLAVMKAQTQTINVTKERSLEHGAR